MSAASAADSETRRERWRPDGQLLGLALTAGGVDAATYIALGRAFPANMTGNTVLLAIDIVGKGGGDAWHAAITLGGFSLGVVCGTLLTGGRAARAKWSLLLQTALLVAALLVWALLGVRQEPVRDALLAGASMAMGLQAAAVRLADTAGVAATYVTGTLTHALARQTARLTKSGDETPRERRARRLAELDWLAYGAGALVTALVTVNVSRYAFAFPAATAVIGTAIALRG